MRARRFADALAAAVVIGILWLPPLVDGADWRRGVVGFALASVAGAAMVFRWRFPAGSTVVVGIATVAGNILGLCVDPMLATAWCLYPVAVARAARPRVLVLVVVGLLAALATVTAVPQGDAGAVQRRLVIATAVLSVAWLVGSLVGRQIATARAAERVQTQLAAAREVHDIVGHALGVISAEAGVTRSLSTATEQELRDSLTDIEGHARGALEEVQALVRSLRSPPGEAEEAAAGIGQLRSMVATARAAGVDVDARIEVPEGVDDRVGAVVFRIVQESLSNVMRHAPGAACTVEVCRDGAAVIVRVRDDGPGADRPGAGFGLRGMRERARLLGGDVTWRSHPRGGFEVEAQLPTRDSR
jgi:signal transduction histidine kinase